MPPSDASETTPRWRPANLEPTIQVISDEDRSSINKSASKGLPDKVGGLLEADGAARNHSTFAAAVMGISEATRGEKNAVWLELKLWDTLRATGDIDIIQKYRAVSILSAAMAENRLSGGTKHTANQPGISFGKDLDLGGAAATYFLTADHNLEAAEKYVDGHQGQTINSKHFSATEMRELQGTREALAARLDKIYGDHQILGEDGAFVRFREFLEHDPEHASRFIAGLDSSADRALRGKDSAFQGKLCRDAALCYLAAADLKMDRGDGSGARQRLQNAVRYLELAKRIDPAHAKGDVAALDVIVMQLKQRGVA